MFFRICKIDELIHTIGSKLVKNQDQSGLYTGAFRFQNPT
jgi:hypothetical protein